MSTTSASARGDHNSRPQVRLPGALRTRLGQVAKSRRRNASALALQWLDTAVALALVGRTDLLPAKSSAPSAGDDPKNLHYGQTPEDTARYRQVLGDAGSSPLAVIAACAQAYIDADGDIQSMGWPTRDGVLKGEAGQRVAVTMILGAAA